MNRLKRFAARVWWAPAFIMMVLTSYIPPRVPRQNLPEFHAWMVRTSKGYLAWNVTFWIVFIAWAVWAYALLYWN